MDPVTPSPLKIEEVLHTLSNYNDTFGFKVFDCIVQNSKVNQFITLLNDPEIHKYFLFLARLETSQRILGGLL